MLPNIAERVADRLGVRGWEEYTQILNNLNNVISVVCEDADDYKETISLDGYDVIMLKRRIKEQDLRNKQHNNKISELRRLNKNLMKKNECCLIYFS